MAEAASIVRGARRCAMGAGLHVGAFIVRSTPSSCAHRPLERALDPESGGSANLRSVHSTPFSRRMHVFRAQASQYTQSRPGDIRLGLISQVPQGSLSGARVQPSLIKDHRLRRTRATVLARRCGSQTLVSQPWGSTIPVPGGTTAHQLVEIVAGGLPG